MNKTHHWVYILRCENGSYYTGYTTDIYRRYQEHIDGTSKCKYTRSFKPLCIAQCWKVIQDKSAAMKIEKYIKKLSKDEKELLVFSPDKLVEIFKDVSVFIEGKF